MEEEKTSARRLARETYMGRFVINEAMVGKSFDGLRVFASGVHGRTYQVNRVGKLRILTLYNQTTLDPMQLNVYIDSASAGFQSERVVIRRSTSISRRLTRMYRSKRSVVDDALRHALRASIRARVDMVLGGCRQWTIRVGEATYIARGYVKDTAGAHRLFDDSIGGIRHRYWTDPDHTREFNHTHPSDIVYASR